MGTILEADVIVIGGGASGITAAVAAAEKDASVIVLEKGSTTGGAANMGMGIFAVESKYQKAQLVDFTKLPNAVKGSPEFILPLFKVGGIAALAVDDGHARPTRQPKNFHFGPVICPDRP